MRILGVDPGLATVGFGVIDVIAPRQLECVTWGCLRTAADLPFPTRLRILYEDMGEILKRYNPDEVAMERLFFNTNVTTGISVSHARGVLILAVEQAGLPFFEYTPLQIKSRVLGYGHGEKKQIQYIVMNTLGLEEKPKPDDAADGLAIAICHSYTRMKDLLLPKPGR